MVTKFGFDDNPESETNKNNMAKRDLIEENETLKLRETELTKVCSMSFSTQLEAEKYIKENEESFLEFKLIRNRMREIEWLLMFDEEKRAHLKYLDDLKKKFED